ncbi:MAG TPA: hypothetical protein DDZ80_31795 [Cyanobacteria bacterium UBA8803]|nr:hypothetical protein [Cyanobacteria bacterium UBA9273]HBL62792.1 hypothetical protein [Cyanobacteria bacterium UBA8803]
MIPDFDENGKLPPGIHFCTWEEFTDKFGTTLRRLRLINGLKLAMGQLKAVGCQFIYINGSFVTEKLNPGDFDACWDANGVDINYLEALAPVLYNPQRTAQQKAKYGGEFFRSDLPADSYGTSYLDFFQFDTRTNTPKGIIAIDLSRWNDD